VPERNILANWLAPEPSTVDQSFYGPISSCLRQRFAQQEPLGPLKQLGLPIRFAVLNLVACLEIKLTGRQIIFHHM
jgi:hypothetical protein